MISNKFLNRTVAAAVFACAMSLPATAAPEQVLRVVPPSDLKILDPIWTTATISRQHGYMVYDTLFGMDEHGAIHPQMVEQYSVNDEHTQWRFTLRSGLKFSDGTPITTKDVIASLQRWGQRDVLGQQMYAALERIEADDDNTLHMVFREPFGAVLDALGKPNSPVPFIMPAQVAATPADQQIDDLTGSGPFMLEKTDFRPGDRVSYRKNPHYQARSEPGSGYAGGKHVHVDRVDWIMLTDPQTQANALLTGEIDMTETIPSGSYEKLRAEPSIELVPGKRQGGIYTAIFNHQTPPFDHPKIRRAALLAVNQAALMRAQIVYPDLYRTCASIFLCGSPYADENSSFFTGKPDFAAARQLLQEAGYDNQPVVLMLPSDFPFLRVIPNVYAQLLKQAGFNVDTQSVDWATLVARRANKKPANEGGWNVFVTYWGAEDANTPLTYTPLTGSGDQGYFGWPVVPELEQLKTEFTHTTDPEQRKNIARQIQDVALEAGVFAPLGQVQGPVPVRKGVVSDFLTSPGALIFWNLRKTE